MPRQLLESDFLTTDLSAIFKNSTSTTQTNNQPAQGNSSEGSVVKPDNYDWSNELKDRLSSNKQTNQAYVIEEKFFAEFFTNLFKKQANKEELTKCALRIGALLQKDIKVLGFKKDKNPILKFLANNWVQQNLLKTGLLNSNTYKAIHNAVAKNLMADSEFQISNDYNIIYCRDLYSKSAKDMEMYLVLQHSNLGPDNYIGGKYSLNVQNKNKKIFFYIKAIKEQNIEKRKKEISAFTGNLPSAKQASTVLNHIDFARAVSGIDYLNRNTAKNSRNSNKSINGLMSKIATPEQFFAAIQYLSIETGSTEARQALNNSKFKGLRADTLVMATNYIAQIMPNKLSNDEANALLSSLLDKLNKDF